MNPTAPIGGEVNLIPNNWQGRLRDSFHFRVGWKDSVKSFKTQLISLSFSLFLSLSEILPSRISMRFPTIEKRKDMSDCIRSFMSDVK